MKAQLKILLLLASAYSSASFSDVIQPSLDINTPTTLTSSVEIIADFGAPGYNIELNNLLLDVTFSNNLFSDGETFGLSWLVDPALRRERSLTLGTAPSKTSLSIGISNNLLINDDGLAYFDIFVSGGNGVNLTNITLTADANIQAVPLPSSILLFVSGLLLISRNLYTKKHT